MKGETVFTKSVDLNNQNQVGTGENVAIAQQVESDGGRIVVDEDASIFNAGQATKSVPFLCPFSNTGDGIVPPFNEAVVMGSHIDAGAVSSASETGIVGVAATGDVPSMIHMDLAATGSGIVSTYMGVNAQDARGTGTQLVTPEKTTTIPGSKTTTVITPGTTTVTKTPAVIICGKVIVPEKTTTVTTDPVTKTVTTKDQKVTTPAVYTPVTPSSDIRYSERTNVQGTFTFAKNMQYTSQVG